MTIKKNKEPNNDWQQIVESLEQGVIIVNIEGHILYVNPVAAKLFGQTPLDLVGTNFFHPSIGVEKQEIEVLKSKNEIITAQMTIKPGAWHDLFAWIIFIQDVTDYKEKESRLTVSSQGMSAAFEGIVVTDAKGVIVDVNNAFLSMTGYKRQEIIGQTPKVWQSGRKNKEFYEGLWHAISEEGSWSGEIWDKKKDQTLFSFQVAISTVKNAKGEIINYLGFFHDLTEVKFQQEQIKKSQFYELETGLPNKLLLTKKLEHKIHREQKNGNPIFILDVRVFETVTENEVSSQERKDNNLIIPEVIRRIKTLVHGENTIARVGRDEFVVLCCDEKSIDTIQALSAKLIHTLIKPYFIGGETYFMSSVIGVSESTSKLNFSAQELLRQASFARHDAMLAGSNQYSIFDIVAEKRAIKFRYHVKSVHNAIKLNQLELYYQPKVNLESGQIIGAEALLRWNHPEKGVLAPGEFLYDLDNQPIALEIGDWVLNKALQQIVSLQRDGLTFPLSINISSFQLQDPEFVNNLMRTLKQYPEVPAHALVLEVLETEALNDVASVSRIIDECRMNGISFSLDDFGKGHASLTYLKDLNTAEVKLDQSFIREIFDKPNDLAILKSTIDLCKLINRELISEGVETMTHGKLLFHLGCVNVQGYAIARPMPASALVPWVKNWKLDPRWTSVKFSKEEIDQLLNASIVHYANFSALVGYLSSTSHAPPPDITLKSCLKGKWIKAHQSKFKDRETFEKIDSLHKLEHRMAKKIIHLAATNQKAEAYVELEKLVASRKEIFKNLIDAVFEA